VTSDGLAPGAATPLFQVPFALITELELWIDGADCALDNNRYLFAHPNGDLICPI
jgi:hypothetical protein